MDKNNNFIYGTQYYRKPTPDSTEWEKDLANMKKMGLKDVKFWVQWRGNHIEEDKFDFSDIDTPKQRNGAPDCFEHTTNLSIFPFRDRNVYLCIRFIRFNNMRFALFRQYAVELYARANGVKILFRQSSLDFYHIRFRYFRHRMC